MAEVRVRDEEFCTVRNAMRELNRLVDRLEHGELEKLVLMQRNRMKAVVLTPERFGEMQRAYEAVSSRAQLAEAGTPSVSRPGSPGAS